MTRSRPLGNLTAWLVLVALLELVFHRLVGRLFIATSSCQSVSGCLVARAGPFLHYLSGVLTLILLTAGIAGHLERGELFPRGLRITLTGLALVFASLVAVTLVRGPVPDWSRTPLETSFGFVLVLLTLAFLGSAIPGRARAGLALLVLATLLEVAATLLSRRAGWTRHSALTPMRLTVAGEAMLLLGAAAAPLLLGPRGVSRPRAAAALALAAGITAFFFVALLGRYDLMQTAALYTLHLDLPRALSPMGVAYAAALFGFLATLVLLLSGSGADRLAGYGLALIALGGYQSDSPVGMALTTCGYLALATAIVRREAADAAAPLGIDAWRALVAAVATEVADASVAGAGREAPRVEGETVGDDDVAAVRTQRRSHPIALTLRRSHGAVRDLEVVVGEVRDTPPDATIEPHESWLARSPTDRLPLPRQKTGDRTFDQRLSVHGRAPLDDQALRRRVLRHADGTVTLWRGSAARYRSSWSAPGSGDGARLFRARGAPRTLADVVDTLIDLVEAGAAEPAPPPASSG